MTKAVHAFVSGQVQQVGYRQGCRQMARSLGLVGWVKNVADGRVEIFAQGRCRRCRPARRLALGRPFDGRRDRCGIRLESLST